MSYLTRASYQTPPRNLCELLLRDVSSLLITSHLVSRSVKALRPKCNFSRELTATLDSVVSTSDAGELLLNPPLIESGAVLPNSTDARESAMLTDFFVRVPARGAPAVVATQVAANLRLLAQHIELKARLAAEEALMVGQNALCHALMLWAAEWRACGQALRNATARARTKASVADVEDFALPALQTA